MRCTMHTSIGLVRGGEETNWVSRNIYESIMCYRNALQMHFSPRLSTRLVAFAFSVFFVNCFMRGIGRVTDKAIPFAWRLCTDRH